MADMQQKRMHEEEKEYIYIIVAKLVLWRGVPAMVDDGGTDYVKLHAKHSVAITIGMRAWCEIKMIMLVSGLEVKNKVK